MKIYLRNPENFNPETLAFYKKNFEIVDTIPRADIAVINDFRRIVTNKIVACNSTGIDHIKAKKIISLRGENLSDLTAVPELCLGMAIYLTRTFKQEEIRGKTLGIIGYGRIGRIFAFMAKNMGMKVKLYDTKLIQGNLDNLLKESDIVSLHITADKKNSSYFTRSKFEKMKDGAIFLNSARNWLVDYPALRWALDNKLSCAWFDFEMSFEHKNLITTPHLGGTTKESKKISEMIIAKKLCQLKKS
jgi:phosphoglycerate dehydrogenase-like enzyme